MAEYIDKDTIYAYSYEINEPMPYIDGKRTVVDISDIKKIAPISIKEVYNNLISEESTMTNREYLQTLDNDHFLKATSAFYFRYPLWTGKDYKDENVPNNKLLAEWLNKPYDPESLFWKYVLSEEPILKSCITCKHTPPSKKWPCEECDMNCYDRWEERE